MSQALSLAALGEGTVSPNPRVGCVVVRDDRVVGGGYHRAAGQPHAEALALARAGERSRGATLYVGLEPCAHHGRTPPCAEAIIRAGIKRVVAAMTDPDPRVNGSGFRGLREAGVEVAVGVLQEEATGLNRGFVRWHTSGRPWITLKTAQSVDGLISAREGRSKWITGEAARRFGHRLRWWNEAILVGAGTVRRDDPALTVRLRGLEARRRVIVLSARLDLDPEARVFGGEPAGPRVRIYTSEDADFEREARLQPVAEIRRVGAEDGELDLSAVLDDLGRSGVQSVLVEGGGRTIGRFLEAGLADEAALFEAPILMGARGATPAVDAATVDEPARGFNLVDVKRVPLGRDLLLLGRIAAREAD
jgi:diaminohydroxyphosphoribosylaminopyrimidine deaminase/5-amino-6-(5-phosphoribosylamino)uracil reductase